MKVLYASEFRTWCRVQMEVLYLSEFRTWCRVQMEVLYLSEFRTWCRFCTETVFEKIKFVRNFTLSVGYIGPVCSKNEFVR
jgi:hypothetical protein